MNEIRLSLFQNSGTIFTDFHEWTCESRGKFVVMKQLAVERSSGFTVHCTLQMPN